MNYRNFILFYVVFICFACTDEDPYVKSSQRTVIVYMAADNNLYKNAKSDIEEMLMADFSANNHLLVYLDLPEWADKTCPQLFEIQQGKMIPVKQYEQQNSASGEVLQAVIKDAITMFPSETYGLILWSHGTGWLPEGIFDALKQTSNLRSFGKDGTNEMSITVLAEAIPVQFEYIIFDACLMGGIEVFYQLRNKANIIIASPTETLVAGFPYDKIIPFLFAPILNYAETAQAYMDYYKDKTGNLQSATIAVVDTKELVTFADLLKKAVEKEITIIPPNKGLVQKYEPREQAVFYDLQDYLVQAIQNEDDIIALKQQLSKIVIYNDFTPYFLNELAIEKSCGISIYVAIPDDDLNDQYKLLDWYKDSNFLPK